MYGSIDIGDFFTFHSTAPPQLESQPNYRQSLPKLEVIKKVYDQILEQNQNNFCDSTQSLDCVCTTYMGVKYLILGIAWL